MDQMLHSTHQSAQVNVRDKYGNAARPAVNTDSHGHVTATIGRWVNRTLLTVADAVPVKACLETAGIAEASPQLNDTGSYQVTVHIDDARVPGSPYNITVTAGPPSAAATTMQVHTCHANCIPWHTPSRQGNNYKNDRIFTHVGERPSDRVLLCSLDATISLPAVAYKLDPQPPSIWWCEMLLAPLN
jgi:hypothetical protein